MAIFGTLDGTIDIATGAYPAIRPTLDLNFAQAKVLDPRVTFYRDSVGTYVDELGVIRTAPNNVPRFDHDPATGQSLGLLIEESRTNLFTYSEQFDSNAWTKNQVTVTSNQGIAPDGTLTADLVTTNTVSSYNTIDQFPTLSTNTNYCYSVFVKLVSGSGTSSRATLGSANSAVSPVYASWGLQLDTLAETTDGSTPTIKGYISYPNGWYRIYMVLNTSGQTNANVGIRFGTGGVDVVSTFYIWGAQLEVGSFPTSYIPTTASAVTRAADVAYIGGTNFTSWYNQSEGTAFSAHNRGPNSGANMCVLSIDNATSAERIELRATGGNAAYFRYEIVDNSSSVFSSTDVLNAGTNSPDRAAIAYKLNDSVGAGNGLLSPVDDSVTIPTVNRLLIGNSTFNVPYSGTISRITYYPKRLTNTQLQNLTA